jgi:hypothetical protein
MIRQFLRHSPILSSLSISSIRVDFTQTLKIMSALNLAPPHISGTHQSQETCGVKRIFLNEIEDREHQCYGNSECPQEVSHGAWVENL